MLCAMAEAAQRRHVTDYLSPSEIRELCARSDARALLALLTTWGIVAGSFALVAWHPAWWTVALALVLIGGRQLALSVLMHDAAHRSLFESKRLNLLVGEWLCAAPMWNSLERYRKHHLSHHAHTNEPQDPDLVLVENFPITRASLLRKFARDLIGLTALKRVVALLLMDLGLLAYSASPKVIRLDQSERKLGDYLSSITRNFGPVLVTNLALGGLLAALGHGRLYLLWVLAYFTTFSLFLRIRAMAEHACTDPSSDPFLNTRTTQATWLAKLTVAPHAVNYHLEHHLLPTVPLYGLPRMHALLRERGALDESPLSGGYFEVLREVSGASSRRAA